MGHTDPNSYLWRIGIEFRNAPQFATHPAVDGVSVYWQDVRQHCPGQAVFITNVDSRGFSPLLGPVLACLGLRAPVQ